MKIKDTYNDWKQDKADVFWGEIAPCEHVLQIYENDSVFLDALAGFVGGGINANEACIVIATEPHLEALASRLRDYGIHLENLISESRYIPLNAEEVLSRFMVNDWPDDALFFHTVHSLFEHAGYNKRRIRAFGEMVAIPWAKGLYAATVHLEQLWNKFCEEKSFCLFCAYPKSGFTGDINVSFNHICGSHSKMIAGSEKQLIEVKYRDIFETVG